MHESIYLIMKGLRHMEATIALRNWTPTIEFQSAGNHSVGPILKLAMLRAKDVTIFVTVHEKVV